MDEKYKLDEVQLITDILDKIMDKSSCWDAFKTEYRKRNAIKNMAYSEFKEHLKHEWDSIGAPPDKLESKLKSDGEDKLLNVKTVGAKYFPGKCSRCHKKGHKVKDCTRKKGDDNESRH